MQEGQSLQALRRVRHLLEFGLRQTHERVECRIDGGHQYLFLALEVEIDGAIGNIGASSNVGNTRGEEALFGEDGHGRVENALVFVSAAVHADWRCVRGRQCRLLVSFCHGPDSRVLLQGRCSPAKSCSRCGIADTARRMNTHSLYRPGRFSAIGKHSNTVPGSTMENWAGGVSGTIWE